MECPTFNLSFDDSPVPPVLSDSLLLPEQADNVTPNIVEQEASLEKDLKHKKVKFSKHQHVRIFSEQIGNSSDSTQVCSKVEQEMKELKPVVYLMSTVCGIDHSTKELFYRTLHSSPMANPIALIPDENDFYAD